MIPSHELDAFLRGRRVGILSMNRGPDKPPLTHPIWYDYDGKTFRVQVEDTSAKAKLLRRVGKAPCSFAVQSEVPPYRYAIAYGTAALAEIGAAANAELRRSIARRYVGRAAGAMYIADAEKQGWTADRLALIEITPDRFVTHDFRPEAGLSGRAYFGVYRWLRPVPA